MTHTMPTPPTKSEQLLSVMTEGFERLHQRTDALQADLHELKTDMAVQKEQINQLSKSVNGNGASLHTRVVRIEENVKDLDSDIKKLDAAQQQAQEEQKKTRERWGERLWDIFKPFLIAALGGGAVAGAVKLL